MIGYWEILLKDAITSADCGSLPFVCSTSQRVYLSSMFSENIESLSPEEIAVIRKLKPITTLLSLVGPFIGLLNFLSQIVAGIWLAVIGEWGALITGLLLGLGGNWLIGFALLPTLFFLSLQTSALENGDEVRLKLLTNLTMSYTMVIASIWCCCSFSYIVNMTHSNAIIPAALWAYSVATTPWVYMASKERESVSTLAGALFIQVSAMVLIVGFLAFHFTLLSALALITPLLVGCAVYQASLAMLITKVPQKNYLDN